MMVKPLRLLALFTCCCFLPLAAQARTITYNNDASEKEQYYVNLLLLALEKSQSGITAKPAADVLNAAQLTAEVQSGSRAIFWGAASKENESLLRPIRIPLVKGLLGHRVFIIKQGEQHKFDNIQNLQDLKTLVAGQGRFWGDTPILSHAGLPLEDPVKYESLFYMLEGSRFDYFPRAVHEPWSEVKAYPQLDLTIEKSLMLIYPLAMYFYVNKSDAELANALEKGLELAIADGSFDNYFYTSPIIQSVLKDANLHARKAFRLENPYLPDATPLDRKELWFDIASIP